jgi:alkylresorcinol/alkylpyrone synthase
MIAHRPSNARILATRTLLPPLRHTADDVEGAFMRWLAGEDRDLRVRAQRILRNGGVDGRHSFLPLDEIFAPRSLESAMALYREHAVTLGTRALAEGLAAAGVAPDEVDILITTSCTGYMIPSADAYMAERLGCAATSCASQSPRWDARRARRRSMYAAQMLRRHRRRCGRGREHRVFRPTPCGSPTSRSRTSWRRRSSPMESAARCFARGEGPARATIRDWRTHQVERTTHVLGYDLTGEGFRMNLDESLPEIIAAHFGRATDSLLAPHGLTPRRHPSLRDPPGRRAHPRPAAGTARAAWRKRRALARDDAPLRQHVEQHRHVHPRLAPLFGRGGPRSREAPRSSPASALASAPHQLLLDVHAPVASAAAESETTCNATEIDA